VLKLYEFDGNDFVLNYSFKAVSRFYMLIKYSSTLPIRLGHFQAPFSRLLAKVSWFLNQYCRGHYLLLAKSLFSFSFLFFFLVTFLAFSLLLLTSINLRLLETFWVASLYYHYMNSPLFVYFSFPKKRIIGSVFLVTRPFFFE
jgi:hypothetical protein